MSGVIRYPLYRDQQHVATLLCNDQQQMVCEAEPPYALLGLKPLSHHTAKALLPEVHRCLTRQTNALFTLPSVPRSMVLYASFDRRALNRPVRQYDNANSMWLVLDDFFNGDVEQLFAISVQAGVEQMDAGGRL